MAKIHDRGGWSDSRSIDTGENVLSDWEWRTYALMGLLAAKGIMATDEMRRGIEALPDEEYETLGYYERWSTSIERVLSEKGLFTEAEVDAEVDEINQRWG